MEACERCGINENEIKLFDAIWNGSMTNLCERCSIIENIPIIIKPNVSQLKESEQNAGVYDRMKRISGIREPEKQETFFQEDRLNELNSNPELELPERDKLNLIRYFHWAVMKNRRKKGMSQKQLAEELGESEVAIQMIEKAKLPENAEILIRKLEQFFQIPLKKISEVEKLMKQKSKKPTLLDEEGKELEVIPEDKIEPFTYQYQEDEEEIKIQEKYSPIIKTSQKNQVLKEIECRIEPFNNSKQKMIYEIPKETIQPLKKEIIPVKNIPRIDPSGNLDLKKTNTGEVTIGELKKIHEKKVEANRLEQIEEQKKIDERRRILENLREKDRIKIEQRKKQEELEKQNQEYKKQKLIEQRKREIEEQKKEEFQDIDRFLGGMELIK